MLAVTLHMLVQEMLIGGGWQHLMEITITFSTTLVQWLYRKPSPFQLTSHKCAYLSGRRRGQIMAMLI
jgi:hypothetical protein